MNNRSNLKYKTLSQQRLILLLIILLISVLTALKNPGFLMFNSVMNILEQIVVLGLVTAGATILIISGNFDISVGAIIGLSSCLMAMMTDVGVPIPVAAAVDILTAVLCALFNGVLVTLSKALSPIISLITTSVYIGAAPYLTKGVIQAAYGKSDIMDRFRLFGTTPLIFIISLMECTVAGIVLRYTQIGRHISAIGSSGKTALLLGIEVIRNKLIFFALSDFFAGLAAVLLLSRADSVLSSTRVGYELQAAGAVVISGTPINGGKGNIVGAFFGVLLIGFISNALNVLGVNSYLQEITSDALIIISLGVNAVRVHILTKNQGGS